MVLNFGYYLPNIDKILLIVDKPGYKKYNFCELRGC